MIIVWWAPWKFCWYKLTFYVPTLLVLVKGRVTTESEASCLTQTKPSTMSLGLVHVRRMRFH